MISLGKNFMTVINIAETLKVLIRKIPAARVRLFIKCTVKELVAEVVFVPLAAIRVLNWRIGAQTSVASTDIAFLIADVLVQIISLQKDRLNFVIIPRGAFLGIQTCLLRDCLSG